MTRYEEARYRELRYNAARKVGEQDLRRARRTTAKPGHTYYFRDGVVYVGTNAAPFLPSSPIVNGVRMRYSKGRLVPRVGVK